MLSTGLTKCWWLFILSVYESCDVGLGPWSGVSGTLGGAELPLVVTCEPSDPPAPWGSLRLPLGSTGGTASSPRPLLPAPTCAQTTLLWTSGSQRFSALAL